MSPSRHGRRAKPDLFHVCTHGYATQPVAEFAVRRLDSASIFEHTEKTDTASIRDSQGHDQGTNNMYTCSLFKFTYNT